MSNCLSKSLECVCKASSSFCLLVVALALTSGSASAQSKEPWVDSLLNAAASENPSLQHYLDSLGYDIDVANDELQWESFAVDSGVMTARLILEVGNSATSAYFGYFPPYDPENQHILFRGFNVPGDSIQVSFETPTQFGFFMTPALPSVPQTWYTWTDHNVDGYDHVWVFATGQSDTYLIAFEDLPQNGDADFQDLVVEVTFPAHNRPPVFDQANYGFITIFEGQHISFNVQATDPDGTIPMLSISPEMPNVTFTDRHDGTGVFSFTPDFDQAGTYDFVFKADDGWAYGTATLAVAVANVNRAPYFNPDPPATDSVWVGQALRHMVYASDPDGTIPHFTTKTLPENAVFTDNLDGSAQLEFTPELHQAGNVYLTYFVSDGQLADTARVTIKVLTESKAPIISPIDDITIHEAEQKMVSVTAKNPGNAQPAPSLLALDVPDFGFLNAPVAGSGTFFFNPDYRSSGEYDITVMAYNATDTSYLTFHLSVIDVNAQPFVFTDAGRTIYETDTLVYEVESFDADGTTPYLSAYLSGTETLAANMTFLDLRNGTGRLTFIPSLNQGGPASNPRAYYVVFRATDEEDPSVFTVSLAVTIEVIDRPAVPSLDYIGYKAVYEGELLEFPITYHDPVLLGAYLTADPLPNHATFTDNGDGHASFSFRPDYFQAGLYWTVFRLMVDEQVVDSETVRFNVVNVNRAPYIYVQTDSVLLHEGDEARVRVDSYDADSTMPILSAHLASDYWNLAPNMVFVDSLNGIGVLTFAPDYTQGGPPSAPKTYTLVFAAVDSEDSQVWIETGPVTFYVLDYNPPPLLDPIGPREVSVGETLHFTVTARDVLHDVIGLTTSTLPPRAAFSDHADGTGEFVYTPDVSDIGEHKVTFYVSDGVNTVGEEIVITVLRANTAPHFVGLPATAESVEWEPFSLTVLTGDAEEDAVELLLTSGPESAVFTDNGDGTGLFEFSPDYHDVDQAYEVTFIVDDGRANAVGHVQLHVLNAPLQVGQTGDDADVLVDGAVILTFSEPVDESTVAAGIALTTRKGSQVSVRHIAEDGYSHIAIEPAAGGMFAALDTLKITVNHNLKDLAGYPLPQDYTITVHTGAAVFPGDTNNDGVVDERDILPIGTFFGRTGPSRPDPGINWGARAAQVRGVSSSWAPYRAVYADADGSGTVDADDICAISTNWGLTRPGAPRQTEHPNNEALAALGESRVIEQLAAALADCPESAGKEVLAEQLNAQFEPENGLPADFALHQNYPNPFNAGTVISFALPEASRVTLSVYNTVGQRVATLIDQTLPAGDHNVYWDGRDDSDNTAASGVYFYRLETGNRTVSRRMVLLK